MMPMQEISGLIAERALNSIPAGLTIAFLAWMGLKAFSKEGPRVRFAVWFIALLGIAAAPFLPSFAAPAATPVVARMTISAGWADVIFGLWATVAVLFGVRLLFGIWKLWGLKREATPIAYSELPPEAQRAIHEFRSKCAVEVCSSQKVRVPTALGFFKARVLLPEWALAELSERDLTAVLIHELAHLQRKDDWTNLAQKVLGAAFFFHPAVWWIERRLTLEREMACDELVLAKTGNRHAYAECLVSLAEKSFAWRGIALAQAAIGHAKGTALRLRRILDPSQTSTPNAYAGALTLALAAVMLCVVLASGAPKLVAFRDAASFRPAFASKVSVHEGSHAIKASAMVGTQLTDQHTFMNASYHPERAMAARMQHHGAEHARHTTIPQPRRIPAPLLARETVPSDQARLSSTRFVLVVQTSLEANGELRTNFAIWKLTFREPDNRAIRAQIVTSTL